MANTGTTERVTERALVIIKGAISPQFPPPLRVGWAKTQEGFAAGSADAALSDD